MICESTNRRRKRRRRARKLEEIDRGHEIPEGDEARAPHVPVAHRVQEEEKSTVASRVPIHRIAMTITRLLHIHQRHIHSMPGGRVRGVERITLVIQPISRKGHLQALHRVMILETIKRHMRQHHLLQRQLRIQPQHLHLLLPRLHAHGHLHHRQPLPVTLLVTQLVLLQMLCLLHLRP